MMPLSQDEYTPAFMPAQPKDIDNIAGMMEAFYAIDGYPFDLNRTRQNLTTFINGENLGRVWLILHEQEVIGYVVLTFGFSFEFGGRDAFLDELYLKAACRNRGLGSKTVDYITTQAGTLGIKAVHLEVEHHNEKGKAIYRKSGFKAHDRILMTKMIDQPL